MSEESWGTVLGNNRRAGYEQESVSDSPSLAWRVDAGSGLRSALLLTDSVVFAATTNRQLSAYHVRTGRRFWYHRFDNSVTAHVLRSGRRLFAATAGLDGHVHGLDITRGRRQWRREVGAVTVTPLLDNAVLYVATDQGQVAALRTDDGRFLWRIRIAGGAAATPVDLGPEIALASGRDTLYVLSKQDGRVTRRTALESTVSAAPALHSDTLVLPLNSGVVLALHVPTLQPVWRIELPARVLAAPAIAADGTVFLLTRQADLWRVQGGQPTRLSELKEAAAASLTLARDRLLVGCLDGTLLATDLHGEVVWRYQFDDSIVESTAVKDGAVYVPLLHGGIGKLR